MVTCKKCGKEFDERLGVMSVKELRDINYDPSLVSDAKDQNYCSKRCEKEDDDTVIDFGLEVFMGKTLAGNKRSADVVALDSGLNGSCAKIAKDKTMSKYIMEGKGNDPVLKRDATAIEQEKVNNSRKETREHYVKRVSDAKARYRAKYGVSA